MRKPRDYDAELKALDDKARKLKERRVRQLGELVIACGADALSSEQLAGALLSLKDASTQTKEAWRSRGAAFFRGEKAKPARKTGEKPNGTLPLDLPPPSPRA
ncbi:hypothetical protein ACFB49_31130 [Sphingomonas sp. DBB INV C78]|uniref:conjugal transfer protein TraD n=1 Tax=Sphingomonas sp. DBB INV C78 TaxID=3349434 RepID=UPI0036D32642